MFGASTSAVKYSTVLVRVLELVEVRPSACHFCMVVNKVFGLESLNPRFTTLLHYSTVLSLVNKALLQYTVECVGPTPILLLYCSVAQMFHSPSPAIPNDIFWMGTEEFSRPEKDEGARISSIPYAIRDIFSQSSTCDHTTDGIILNPREFMVPSK